MKPPALALTALLLLLSAPPSRAQGLPTAKPEDVGLSSERLARIGAILRDDVERGRIPGVVIMVARRGKLAYVQSVGFRDKAAGAPMTADATFSSTSPAWLRVWQRTSAPARACSTNWAWIAPGRWRRAACASRLRKKRYSREAS